MNHHVHRAKHALSSLTRRIVKRFVHARTRMKIAAIGALLLSLTTTCFILIHDRAYPNTSVHTMNVSGKTKKEIEAYIFSLLMTPYKMRVLNKEYMYTYEDFGIEINTDAVLSAVFEPNTSPFPYSIVRFFQSLSHPRTITIPLDFTQDYGSFLSQTTYSPTDEKNTVSFDQQDKSLTVIENEETYEIDDREFRTLLTNRLGASTVPLYPKLKKRVNSDVIALESIGERIKAMFLSPLTVYVDSGNLTKSFVLTERELADIATVSWQTDEHQTLLTINERKLFPLINERVKRIGMITKGNIVSPKVVHDLHETLLARYAGKQIDAIKIFYDQGPNSDGTLADSYIEVDISQQKMYLFKHHAFYKEYRVSTGKDYPTPTGEFTILNKTGLGFSTIYNVWMAWWMGFKYSDELHAYFGIHELPYTLTDTNKIQRPADFIGTPNTGGCVALGVGDAKAVYQFADIGTKVVIFP